MAKAKKQTQTVIIAGVVAILVILFVIYFATKGQTAQFGAAGHSGFKVGPTPTCSDSDGGENTNITGTCKDSTGSKVDNCAKGIGATGVNEYFCSGLSCVVSNIACPSGKSCKNGACV